MTKKDNLLLKMLRGSCKAVRKRAFITTLLFSIFMLFGCSTSQGQLAVKSAPKAEPFMLAKIDSHYKKWQYTPYRYGGTTLSGSDCSGLVMNFFKTKLSKTLPRSTAQQAKLGHKVTKPQAGDLVFFKTGRGGNGLHVGIYYANGMFLHASTTKGVTYSSLNEDYWKKHYWMTRRLTDAG